MQHPKSFRAFPALIGAALMGLSICAAGAARADDPIFPPASHVGLVPPAGFALSAAFQGFQHNDMNASILVAELPGYTYESIDKDTATELQKNPAAGARRAIELKNGARGFVVKQVQPSPQGDVLKWTLVANAKDVTALVTAIIPEAVKEAASEQSILAAFATLAIRASVPVDEQLSVLPFRMNELAGFRIVRVQPGAAAMLTDGPKDAIEAVEQPLLLVSITAAGTPPPPSERDSFARRMIGEMPGMKDMRVLRSEPMRIANQQGHEVLIEAKDIKTGTELNAVQWVRFGSGTLMRIFAVSRKDTWHDMFDRFRKVRDGIGPR